MVALGVAALASRRGIGTAGGRRVESLPEAPLALAVAGLLVAGLALLVGFAGTLSRVKRDAGDDPPRRPSRIPAGAAVVATLAAAVALAVAVPAVLDGRWSARHTTPRATDSRPQPPPARSARERQPGGDGAPLVALAAVLVVATGAAGVAAFRAKRGPADEDRRQSLARATADAGTELASTRDPRAALLAAYAAMEATLAAAGSARRPADAPQEYLRRVSAELKLPPDAAATLTGLFELARFSAVPIDAGMVNQADRALGQLRDGLGAAS